MVSLFHVRQYPAGREPRPSELPNDTPVSDAVQSSSTLNDPEPRDDSSADGVHASSDVLDSIHVPRQEHTNQDHRPAPGPGTHGSAPVWPLQPGSGYFVPSSGPNNQHPTPANLPGSSSISNLPLSSTVNLSTNTLHPTPTALSSQGEASSSGLSTTNKYIIGGSVGGGGLLLILLGLLLLCCRKRRAKRDLERSGECQHGQFTSCNHGTCNTGNVQTPMGQRTPLKPFVLKSDPEAFTIKEVQRQPVVTISLNRRDSTGSQKSAGSDTASNDSDSLSDGDSRRGKKGTHKRPPPLKLTSLVTPVINGPQHNPRDKAHSSLRDPPEIPVIVVDPPQSDTPERIQRL